MNRFSFSKKAKRKNIAGNNIFIYVVARKKRKKMFVRENKCLRTAKKNLVQYVKQTHAHARTINAQLRRQQTNKTKQKD